MALLNDIWEHVLAQYASTHFMRVQLVSKSFYRLYWQNCSIVVFKKDTSIPFLLETLSRLNGSKVRHLTFKRGNLVDKIAQFNNAQGTLLVTITSRFPVLEYLSGIDLVPETALLLIKHCPLLRNFRIAPGHFTQHVMNAVVDMKHLENFEFFRTRSQLALMRSINAKVNKSVLVEFISRAPPTLKFLNLTACADDEILQKICEFLPNLEALVLEGCSEITNKLMPEILNIERFPNLVRIVVANTNVQLTEEIYELVRKNPNLDKTGTWLQFMAAQPVDSDLEMKDYYQNHLKHLFYQFENKM